MTTGYEYGGPELGSGDPTGSTFEYPVGQRWEAERQVRYVRNTLQNMGIPYGGDFRANVETITRDCTNELISLEREGRERDFNEHAEECTTWLNELTFEHLNLWNMIGREGRVNWAIAPTGLSLPDSDWLGYVTGVPVEVWNAYDLALEQGVLRQVLKNQIWNGTKFWFFNISALGFLDEGGYDVGTGLSITAAERLGSRGPLWSAWIAVRLFRGFNNLALFAEDMWGRFTAEKDSRKSESYTAPREWEGYEEGSMPYNRRTGQWYPSRRYGRGSYNRGYRRYNRYGNRGGWSPRRRRTYRRW